MRRRKQVTMTLGIDVMDAVCKLAKPRKRSELVDGVLRCDEAIMRKMEEAEMVATEPAPEVTTP